MFIEVKQLKKDLFNLLINQSKTLSVGYILHLSIAICFNMLKS